MQVPADEFGLFELLVDFVGREKGLEGLVVVSDPVLGIAEHSHHVALEFGRLFLVHHVTGFLALKERVFILPQVIVMLSHEVMHNGFHHIVLGGFVALVQGVGDLFMIKVVRHSIHDIRSLAGLGINEDKI